MTDYYEYEIYGYRFAFHYDRFSKSYYIMKYSDYYNAWMRLSCGIKTISECKDIAKAYIENQ